MELCVERERKYKNSSGDFLYALTRDTKILNLNPPPYSDVSGYVLVLKFEGLISYCSYVVNQSHTHKNLSSLIIKTNTIWIRLYNL